MSDQKKVRVGYGGYDNGMGVFEAAGEQGAREGLKQALALLLPVAALAALINIKRKRSVWTGRKRR